jgi:glutamate/tyrosine decarboxylase-like PLP-dependent enzyme
LNVPYDCGVVVVRDAQALRSAMGLHASYLLQDADGSGDPSRRVPELSRRARGVPVWAALKRARDVVRISVSNWTTDADDVTTAVEAVRTAVEAVRSGGP